MLPFRFILVTDRNLSPHDWIDRIVGAVEAGVRAVQLREKDLSDGDCRQIALEWMRRLKSIPFHLFVNGRPGIARELGLHLHLPERGFSIAEAREEIGDRRWIGASVHSLERAQRAESEGADFILFGPVFETDSKKMFGPPQGLGRLQEVTQQVSIPVFAIGGIAPDRASQCLQRGAYGVAAISAVFQAPHPEEVLSDFEKALGSL